MSLTVESSDDVAFRSMVEAALKQACPCLSLKVDAATGKVSVGTMDCSCYCNHPAGCNLLADLVNDARAITIWYSADSSGYLPGNEIWWYPGDVSFSDTDVCGHTLIPGSIILAHEMVHARFNSDNEDVAVRGENQIRLERCMPMRTSYVNPVAGFRDGVLDASIRPVYGCTCSFWRGGFWATIGRIFCALHSMYCFPNFWKIWTLKKPQGGGTPHA